MTLRVPAPPPEGRLPDGFAVRLDPRTRRRDGGAVLLGGSPLRQLRLTPRAAGFLDGWARDEAVDPDAFVTDAAAALYQLTGGKPRELARLLRLSALASQADGGAKLDAAAIEALRAELIG